MNGETDFGYGKNQVATRNDETGQIQRTIALLSTVAAMGTFFNELLSSFFDIIFA
jgi:hypothetical protein